MNCQTLFALAGISRQYWGIIASVLVLVLLLGLLRYFKYKYLD